MYNHPKVSSRSATSCTAMSKASIPKTSISACTLLPMGLKFEIENKTDNRSHLQPRCKHHESCTGIFCKHHWFALSFPDYFLFQKIFFKALFTTNFHIKDKSNGRKTLVHRHTGRLKQMIKLPVLKLSQIYFNGCPCVSTEPKISEL